MTSQEQFNQILNQIKEILNILNPKEKEEVIEDIGKSESEKRFYRRCWSFTGFCLVGFACLTALTYKYFIQMFAINFSFFFVFAGLALMILLDEFILPGNTIKKVSQNAIASSILWLSFSIIICIGFLIGNTIISDPFRGEESNQSKSSTEITIPNNTEQAPARGFNDTITEYKGESEK
jgi:hypothetical protein